MGTYIYQTCNQYENLRFVLEAEGTTNANKNEVCTSVAFALNGIIQYCGFETPPEGRRYLTNLQRLYMDVSVLNITEAQDSIESENFIDSLEDLPAEVSISGIIPQVSIQDLTLAPSIQPVESVDDSTQENMEKDSNKNQRNFILIIICSLVVVS